MADLNTPELKTVKDPNLVPTKGRPKSKGKTTMVPNPLMEHGPSTESLQHNRESAQDASAQIGKFDPEKITFQQMYQMRRDPTIAMGLHFLNVPLINAKWSIQCEDPQVAAFITEAWKRIHTSFMLEALTSLEFGFAAVVKRFEVLNPDWTYEDANGNTKPVWPDPNIGAIVWNTPKTLRPETVEPAFTKDGARFDGIKIKNSGTAGQKDTVIPTTHCHWFTNEKEKSFGNWYGYPRTGYAFRYWWSYWYRWILGDRHFETDADPPLVVGYPSGKSVDDNGDEVDHGDVALAIGADIRDGATVALPTDVYMSDDGKSTTVKMWTIDFLKGGENLKAFHDSFEYIDVMKLRSLFMPEQALIEGKGGTSSRNVMGSAATILEESQEITLSQIAQEINQFWLKDLVDMNFVEAPACTFVIEGLREEDRQIALELMKLLVNRDQAPIQLDWKTLAKQARMPVLNDDQAAKQQAKLDAAAFAPKAGLAPAADPNAGIPPVDPSNPVAPTSTAATKVDPATLPKVPKV